MASATYDLGNRQVTFGGQALTYDLDGNLTSDGTNTYTWNARNQLVGINGASVTASFTYDAFTRRRSKVVNGTSTQFLYDGLNPVQEIGAATTVNLNVDAKVDAKDRKLTEDEIKTLVVDDKWLATLTAALQGELARVSQTLTGLN